MLLWRENAYAVANPTFKSTMNAFFLLSVLTIKSLISCTSCEVFFPLGTNCVSFLIPIYILKDWSDVFSLFSLEESLYHFRHIFVWGGQDTIHMRWTWYRDWFKEKTKKQLDHSFNFRIRYADDIISLHYAGFGGIWINPSPHTLTVTYKLTTKTDCDLNCKTNDMT